MSCLTATQLRPRSSSKSFRSRRADEGPRQISSPQRAGGGSIHEGPKYRYQDKLDILTLVMGTPQNEPLSFGNPIVKALIHSKTRYHAFVIAVDFIPKPHKDCLSLYTLRLWCMYSLSRDLAAEDSKIWKMMAWGSMCCREEFFTPLNHLYDTTMPKSSISRFDVHGYTPLNNHEPPRAKLQTLTSVLARAGLHTSMLV